MHYTELVIASTCVCCPVRWRIIELQVKSCSYFFRVFSNPQTLHNPLGSLRRGAKISTKLEPLFVADLLLFLANVNAFPLIARNDAGTLMEQEMVPTPSDWLLFKARLLKEGRVNRVSISPRGVITIPEIGGFEFYVMADYKVTPNAVFPKEGRPIVFINAGDLNADSEDDYDSYYLNGDRQALHVFPQ